MPETIFTFIVLAGFLLPGLLATKIMYSISKTRQTELYETLLSILSLSFVSFVVLFPFYRDRFASIVNAMLMDQYDTDAIFSGWFITVSLFIMPAITGTIFGLIGYCRPFSRILEMKMRWAKSLMEKQWMPGFMKKLLKSFMGINIRSTQGTEVWDSVFSSIENQRWIRVTVDNRIYEGLLIEASGYPYGRQMYLENVSILQDGRSLPHPDGLQGVLIVLGEGGNQAIEIYE